MSRILVVEDDIMMQNWFKCKLSKHEVVQALNSEEAFNLLNDHEFDIIFLDYDLSLTDKSLNSEPIASFISTLDEQPQIFIHTSNATAALKLQTLVGRSCTIVEKFQLVQTIGDYITL